MTARDSTINSIKAIELIEKYEPCQNAIEWLSDKTTKQAWEECHRGDWMLWYYKKVFPNNVRELALAKGNIANTVRNLMIDQRSIAAVDAAITFGQGLINEAQLKDAADAAADAVAEAAYAATAYTVYAEYAAAVAARAVYAATAYAAAAAAAEAAAAAYDAAADAEARENSLKISADICRKYLKVY